MHEPKIVGSWIVGLCHELAQPQKLTYKMIINMENVGRFFLLLLGFTPCKAEQPLQGMELQEKKVQKG